MARIAGVDVPREKRVVIALTYIYGIGKSSAEEICAEAGVDENVRVRDLSEPEIANLRSKIDEWVADSEREFFYVEGDLRRQTQEKIKRKVEVGSYQGIRHRRGLPVRGQRTHTNARTRKGPRKTVAGKKKVLKKG